MKKSIFFYSYVLNFNELLNIQNMLEFCVLGVVLCFNLFFFESVENVSEICLYGCVVFFNIFNVFMFCLHGNNLTEEVLPIIFLNIGTKFLINYYYRV